MRSKLLICLVVTTLFYSIHTQQQGYVLNLEDLDWTIANPRGYNNVTGVTGNVPGDCFTDLMNAGIIGDPYYRYNDMNYRWISHDNWTYSAVLNVPSYALTNSRIILAFDGLDTIATVKLNDIEIGRADNMFRNWVFDITHIATTSNLISVEFMSSAAYAKQKSDENAYIIPESRYQVGRMRHRILRNNSNFFSCQIDWGASQKLYTNFTMPFQLGLGTVLPHARSMVVSSLDFLFRRYHPICCSSNRS